MHVAAETHDSTESHELMLLQEVPKRQPLSYRLYLLVSLYRLPQNHVGEGTPTFAVCSENVLGDFFSRALT